MTALTVNCPHCGSTNEFFAIDLHTGTEVHCSHCGESIGPWGKLLTAASGLSETAPTFESSWAAIEAKATLKSRRKPTR